MTSPISVIPGIVGPPPGAPAGDHRATVRVGAGAANTRIVSPGNVTTTTVTGLSPGNTYRIRVRAFDAAGNTSAWSDELTVVTTTSTIRTFSSATTTVQATGLTPSSAYTAQVRARDAAGNWSAWSTPAVDFTTTATEPTVVAGRSRPVVRSGTVGLDVTATPPGGQTIASHAWTIQSGGGSLTNAGTATPTYTAPASGSGLVVIRDTVTASGGGVASADVTVSYAQTIIGAENALAGTARATWDLASPNLGGVSTLQGFADGFSFDRSGTVSFKIAQSDTAGWSADIYRLGYYGGDGARSYGTLTPTGPQLTASQAQPAPADADPDTTLLSADCAGWSETLTWTPPTWAPTGMYLLRLNRTGGGASHVMFVLRDDARHAALTFMPADSTWNAYNAWGGMGASMYSGNSLYFGTAIDQYNSDCARYVSYNRPVVNRGAADSGRSYGAVAWSTFFTGEYGMLRFLERNGVDVKYYSCLDASGDATGTHLTGNGSTRGGSNAAIFVGHNEYWSNTMRAGWETAKAAGVSVFSCAGNEVFWRTVGASPDSSGRPRIYECYKSTIAARASTGRTQWTGSWRDPDGAGKGGNDPEVSFTGTIFTVNGPDFRAFVVPFAGGYSAQPLWRHTSVASLTTGQSFTSPSQILGFEWDTYGSAGSSTTGAAFLGSPHPRARFCSDVTYTVSSLVLTDAGDVYGSGNVTHRLVVHPGGNGAITFGTGTVNWALGVDNTNTYQQGSDNTSVVIQQATLNMLTDMGAPPTTLQSGLTQPTLTTWFADATSGLSVTAALTTAATRTTAGGAGLNATATLTTAGVTTPSGGGTLAATATLTTAAQDVTAPTAALNATATLATAATRTQTALLALSVTATLTAGATPTRTGQNTLTVTAALACDATGTKPVGAALAVTAALSSDAFIGAAPQVAGANLAVTATLTAAGAQTRLSGAALAVTAVLSAAGQPTAGIQSTLTVTAALVATAARTAAPAAGLSVTVTLTAGFGVSRTAGALLTVTAVLVAFAELGVERIPYTDLDPGLLRVVTADPGRVQVTTADMP